MALVLGSTIVAVLALATLVFVHELGHWFAGRAAGIAMVRLQVGLGPTLLSRKIGDTLFIWKLIPVLGFVEASEPPRPTSQSLAHVRHLSTSSLATRLFFTLAGPLASLVFGFALDSIQTHCFPQELPVKAVVVRKLAKNSRAEKYGFERGDVVLFETLTGAVTDLNRVRSNPHSSFFATVFGRKHGGRWNRTGRIEVLAKDLDGLQTDPHDLRIRISADLIPRPDQETAGGPISMLWNTAEAAARSLPDLLWLMASFSIGMGLFNLVPVEPLDGGRIARYIVDRIWPQPFPRALRRLLQSAQIAILVVLLTLTFVGEAVWLKSEWVSNRAAGRTC
jgi:regulator of sigma E protease